MKDLLDVHMHTLASGHAYNTIREMIAAGSKKGLALVGIADHAPAMPGSTHRFYFENLRIFDREVYGKEAGVELLMGVELNILNTTGKVDLEEKALRSVDYAIASLHDPCINPGTELDNTTAIMSAMWIPQVKIIGHPDNPRFPVDFNKIAKAAAERHVLLECNNSSYRRRQPLRLARPRQEDAAGLQEVRHARHHGQRCAHRPRCRQSCALGRSHPRGRFPGRTRHQQLAGEIQGMDPRLTLHIASTLPHRASVILTEAFSLLIIVTL